ncbi:uncharacterized protein LOC105195126 [Solenopsis invicta]|uniref:uncharacterized protein LOC105195126 n=1 Tax=Solenopsis invicta TaxID=13686 RepID=UPI000595C1EA|nr:uncharacterized protein LOC105195126 [Solenopsis invicta]
MTMKCMLRTLIIFAVFLCYQSCVYAANCEQEPFHPNCRGTQARKRLTPLPIMRALNCEEGECRFPKELPRMKFLIAILDDTPYRDNEVHPSNSESLHSRKGRMRMEDSRDVYLDDY